MTIELFDINDTRVFSKTFNIGDFNVSIVDNVITRISSKYIVAREDVAKARVKIQLNKNGSVNFSKISLQKGDLKEKEWLLAPEDVQLLNVDLQTSITQNANNIELRATKTELDTINNIVNENKAIIEVTSNAISQKVSSTDVENILNDKSYATKSYVNKIGKYTAYAYSADGTDGFTTVYPNLNLLEGSKKYTKDNPKTVSSSATNGVFYVNDASVKNLKAGTYTMSGKADAPWTVHETSGVNRQGKVGLWLVSTTPGLNVKISLDNTVPKTIKVPNDGDYCVRVNIYSNGTDIETHKFWDFKLEQGSIATPYMPSSSEVKPIDYPSYRGEYLDFLSTASTDPSKYSWSPAGGNSSYIYTAYSWSSDGTDGFTTVYPNLNILDGTKDFSGTWSNSSSWVTDGTYKGLTVKKRTAQWNGINKTFTAPKDGDYTFSAYIKSSGNTANIFRYGSVNGQDKGELAKLIGNNFDWTRDSITVNLKANDTTRFRYEISGSGVDSILWTAGHKLEPGSIATPYMPSEKELTSDDIPKYVGYSVRQSENPKDFSWQPYGGLNSYNIIKATTAIDQNSKEIALKANKLEVDTLSGRVLATESSLQIQDGKITALNTKTDGHTTQIGTLESSYSGLTSTITGLQTDVGGKAEKTELSQLSQDLIGFKTTVANTYADKVSVASQITQSATAVTSNVQSWTNNKLTAYSTTQQTATSITNAVASKADKTQITQLSDSINLKVSKGDVASQINVEAGQILFNSNKLVLNANTTEINGNAFIRGDMIVDGSINAKKIVADSLSALSANLGDINGGTLKLMSNLSFNGMLKKYGIYQSKFGLLSSGPALATTSTVSNSQMGVANLREGELRFIVTDYTENLEDIKATGMDDPNNAFIKFNSYDNGKDVMMIGSSGDIVFKGVTSQDTPWIAMLNGTYYKNMFSRVYISYSIKATSNANILLGVLPVGLRPFRGLHLTANAWGTTLGNDRHIEVRTTGEVTLYNPANGASYDGEVSFTV